MKTKNLLIEIGCEDIPSWAGEHFISRFKPYFLNELNKYKIEAREIMFFFTPRRLVLLFKDLPVKVPPEKKEIIGPRYDIAFDEKHQPTQAAIGFAKAQNISVSSLKIREINGKKVVYAVKTIPGISTESIISNIIPSILRKIDIPRGMKWNEYKDVFYRPVRWILTLFGDSVVRLEFAGIKSSRYTYGHRLLSPRKIKISNWKEYFDKIQKASVILGEDLRENFIFGLVEKSIKKGEYIEKAVLKKLVNLVEYPCLIRCNLPSVGYNIPEEVIKVLIEKAKGIPIFCNGHLTKEFFVVTDGNSSENIRKNYENLLKTRIFDAQFFLSSDMSVSFEEFKKRLDNIVFHQKWGSVSQRVERLKALSDNVSDLLGFEKSKKDILIRAAQLCKYDLASEMVREFPELHGTMGAIYARYAGESEDVCNVISQYKYPVYPGDILPDIECAILLGILDRLDFICGFIAAGVDVSSSEDPYGLRRTASGLFSLVNKIGYELEYDKLVKMVLHYYKIDKDEIDRINTSINEFLMQRFESFLESEGFPKGLRTSILVIDNMNLVRIYKKLDTLRTFIKDTRDAEIIIIPVSRVANILKQAKEKNITIPQFNEGLLKEEVEKNLASLYKIFSKKFEEKLVNKDYSGALMVLSELKKPIDDFFDNVLVMCPEENLRGNRLALLKQFNDIFLQFADFSYIREEDIKNVTRN